MELEVYSRRWGHTDRYKISKTANGWYVDHERIKGECDETGEPYLFKNIDQDGINYPKDLGGYMEWLLDESTKKNMSEEEIQEQLDLIGEWIQITEKASPGGIFSEYN